MKKGDILILKIEDLAFGGKGLARVDNNLKTTNRSKLVVFVDGALPGQTVEVQITKIKKQHAEAKLFKIIKRSPREIQTNYQLVPGAPWACLPVEMQLQFKQKQVQDLFQKFANIDITPLLDEVLASPKIWNYRNKMEFSFGPTSETLVEELDGNATINKYQHHGFGLGSKKRGQFWLVENLEKPSGLFDEAFEGTLPVIRDFCENTGLGVFNQRTHIGFFRYLVVRKSFFSGKFLINLVTTGTEANSFPSNDFVKLLRNLLQEKIAGIFWTQNDGVGDTAQVAEKQVLLFGEPKLTEKINNLYFEISQNSFFQTNPVSAEILNKKCVQYADLKAGDLALDLYCGTGTIGQVLAKNAPEAKVVGVEIVESAVEDAMANARRNELENIKFFNADVRKFLKEYPEFQGKVETVILDPPRSGLSPKALQRAIDLQPKKIVYVSCNPATMARDALVLVENGYALRQLSILDQFPHTAHVECVGGFEKREIIPSTSQRL